MAADIKLGDEPYVRIEARELELLDPGLPGDPGRRRALVHSDQNHLDVNPHGEYRAIRLHGPVEVVPAPGSTPMFMFHTKNGSEAWIGGDGSFFSPVQIGAHELSARELTVSESGGPWLRAEPTTGLCLGKGGDPGPWLRLRESGSVEAARVEVGRREDPDHQRPGRNGFLQVAGAGEARVWIAGEHGTVYATGSVTSPYFQAAGETKAHLVEVNGEQGSIRATGPVRAAQVTAGSLALGEGDHRTVLQSEERAVALESALTVGGRPGLSSVTRSIGHRPRPQPDPETHDGRVLVKNRNNAATVSLDGASGTVRARDLVLPDIASLVAKIDELERRLAALEGR